MKPVLWSAMIVMGLASTIALGRGIQTYTYEELFKEADLVVFAHPLKTEATDDKWESGHLKFTGQNTTLIVAHTLKGDADDEQIRVLHFKIAMLDPRGVMNGPLLMTFKIDPRLVEFGSGPEYLLFLKKTKDGRYEPVSGRFDPVLSIKEITQPGELPDPPKQPTGGGQGGRRGSPQE